MNVRPWPARRAAGALEFGAARVRSDEVENELTTVAMNNELYAALLPIPEVETLTLRNCGLAGGGHAHLRDAATFVKEEWDNMCASSILHCWIKSDILPVMMATNMSSELGVYTGGFNTVATDMADILSMMSSTTLRRDAFAGESVQNVEEGVRHWFTAEDEADAMLDTVDMIAVSEEQSPPTE